jgi:hypothetical protein
MGEEKKKKKAELGEGKKWVDQIIKEKEAWRRHQRQPISFFLSIYMADLQRRKKKTREREREKSRYWFDAIPWCEKEKDARNMVLGTRPALQTILLWEDMMLCCACLTASYPPPRLVLLLLTLAFVLLWLYHCLLIIFICCVIPFCRWGEGWKKTWADRLVFM